MLGAKDPRMTSTGKIDGILQLQFRCYSRQDPPPSRVKPIPLQILRRLTCVAAASNDQELQAVADMIIIAYFFTPHAIFLCAEYKYHKCGGGEFIIRGVGGI